MSFLQLQNLTKCFGDTTAVSTLSLDVAQGEFVSLLGPSGCGKTTTLQMIAGFEAPSEGRVVVNGRDITDTPANRRGIGIVFQSYALFPHMTVFQNVSFGLEMRGTARAEREGRVGEVLELVHLGAFARRYPRELSGGQQQRVALARALVINPELLLLDEPLSALDAKIREDMQIELRAIQRTVGTTTILVTHDQAEAMALSDRIAVMNQGRLVQVDVPYRTYEFPESVFVSGFLGKANLLPGEVVGEDGDELEVRVAPDRVFAAPGPAPGQRVQLSLRPEKLVLVNAGEGRLPGTVRARIFLGHHWVYQVDTPLGQWLVSRQNTGEEGVPEGATVGVDWQTREVRVLGAETVHG